MTIDFRRFSLGKVQVTIERYTSTNTGGVVAYTLAESIPTWASVQPYSTIEGDQIFDPDSGERVEEIRLMYTTERVYMNDSDQVTNPTRDIIDVLGEKWKPAKVEPWLHLNNEHYRVLLRRFDGN